jgi:hypothetical protein
VFSTTALCSLLYALCSIDIIILQLYNEGVYIPFPSCALKLSNLELNSIYLHSLHIKAPTYYGRERIAQGPFTIIQACLHLMTSLIFQNIFKKMCSMLFQLSLISALSRCWLCLHALAMLLHHTPSLENFHGLLSMSSHTVCPCFWISASFSQLASSTGCPFHLTKY